jgi:hypothetical protein
MMEPNHELTLTGSQAGSEYLHAYGDLALQESRHMKLLITTMAIDGESGC